jgi:membrane-bound lytic murein transglycosylase D
MDPARYGFTNIQLEQPMAFDTVRVHESVDLNALGMAAGVTGLEIKDLNPELLQFSTPPPEMCDATGYCLRVPAGTSQNFYKGFALLSPEQKRPWMIHTVERGETLRSIARTYGLTSDQLASYNNLDPSERMRRGTRLRVPMSVMTPGAVASTDATPTDSTKVSAAPKGLTAPANPPVAEVKAPAPPASEAKKIFHRVRKGENLNSIASRYGVRVSDIRNWNNISFHHKLLKGQKLTIYVERAAAAKTVVAEKSSTGKKHWATYKVKRGDTMAKIADDFGVSLAQVKKWNGKSVRHGVKAGQSIRIFTSEDGATADEAPAVAEKSRTHTVRPGETMTSIASMFGTTIEKLSEWNNDKEPSSLQAGEKLNVYAPNKTASKGDTDHPHSSKKTTYKVRRGDTLYSIAEKYGVSVEDLKTANHLTKNKVLSGKRLVIPAE